MRSRTERAHAICAVKAFVADHVVAAKLHVGTAHCTAIVGASISARQAATCSRHSRGSVRLATKRHANNTAVRTSSEVYEHSTDSIVGFTHVSRTEHAAEQVTSQRSLDRSGTRKVYRTTGKVRQTLHVGK